MLPSDCDIGSLSRKKAQREPESVQAARVAAKAARGKKARREAWEYAQEIKLVETSKRPPAINTGSTIATSKDLLKAKRRMEDYIAKIKMFDRKD